MNNNLTLYESIVASSKINPRGLAIFYQNKRISFANLVKRIDRMADILENRLNIHKGDVILISQPNIPDVLVLFYAANKIGAISNMVHPFTPFNQLRSIMVKTKTKVAFIFEQRVAKEVEKYRTIANEIYVTRIEDDLPLFKKGFYHTFMNFKIRKKLGSYPPRFNGFKYLKDLKPTGKGSFTNHNLSDEVSVYLHSGSTTGDPKTICLNNDAFNFIADKYPYIINVEKPPLNSELFLSVLPSFHGFGLEMAMHSPLSNQFGIVMIPKFSSEAVCKAMNKLKITIFIGVPTMYEKLIKDEKFLNHKKLKYLKDMFCGGDAINQTSMNNFNSLMKKRNYPTRIYEGYGLTECLGANIVNNEKYFKSGSLGKPLPDVDIKIFDENGNECKPNEVGEICIKSGSIMLHYLDDHDTTKEALKNGYLHSGDLGSKDEDGFIYFKQRQKRVVKVSGVAVFPSEVEKLIETIPQVKCCCAIQIPDKQLQNALKVFVVSKDAFDIEELRQIILDTCRKYLIRWALPREIEFVDSLPYTLLGKVDFRTLQEKENKKRGVNA